MSLSDATGQTANMTGTEKTDCYSARQRNPEENGELTWVDDAFDETYTSKDDSSLPPVKIVWRNVVLMTLLHIGAVYGLTIVPSAKPFTLVWGRFASFFWTILCANILIMLLSWCCTVRFILDARGRFGAACRIHSVFC